MKVGLAELSLIRGLRETRDKDAMALGTMTYEFEITKARLAQSIANSSAQEDAAGAKILRAMGFDPDGRTLTIDVADGQVKELVGGQWVIALLKPTVN